MELHEFPRPPQDNGRGVHWSLSVYEWGKRGWDFWRDQLLAMKIKWVKIMDDGGGSGLRLARQLIDMEIMPVVRLYRPQQNPGTIGQRGREAVRRYVQAGAMYFETNNEPDLDLEWHIPRPDNWLDLVVQDFIADADIVLEEGGYPAMPAFGVGTQRDPFAKVVERGRRDILDGGAWAAIHLTLCRIISRLAHRQTAPTRGLNTPSVRSSLWTMTYLMARCAWRAKSLTHHSPGRNAMDGVIYPKAATVPFIRSSWSVLLPKPGYVTLPV